MTRFSKFYIFFLLIHCLLPNTLFADESCESYYSWDEVEINRLVWQRETLSISFGKLDYSIYGAQIQNQLFFYEVISCDEIGNSYRKYLVEYGDFSERIWGLKFTAPGGKVIHITPLGVTTLGKDYFLSERGVEQSVQHYSSRVLEAREVFLALIKKYFDYLGIKKEELPAIISEIQNSKHLK